MHTTVLGCGIFGSVSGSSAATCATIAKVALPELKRRGYDEHWRSARWPRPARWAS
jgi:TRAP-type C4-dicarboxylate transport system permease large subunit